MANKKTASKSPDKTTKKRAERSRTSSSDSKKTVAADVTTPETAKADHGGSQAGVRIRMYRLGVGDCFLVRFKKKDGSDYKILIDCGVHISQKGGSDQIKKAVADLATITGGQLDVVVATHEHYDHLSGFMLAEDAFKTMSAGAI